MIDGRVADRHVEYARISRDDVVLEVGPGLGILTERLVERARKVIVIELDPKLADHIEDAFGDRVELIRGDALAVPFPHFDRFVSNLPYSISTPIIFKLFEHEFQGAVIMVQKEFGKRMVAKPGELDYSRLSVTVAHHAECQLLEQVPASQFEPRPRVDSVLVSLDPRPPAYSVVDERLFLRVVNVLFQTRRKKIRTSLRNASLLPDEQKGLPHLDERVERLSGAEIAELANILAARR